MAKRREIPGLNIALLDILTGALGAVIILYVAVPKGSTQKKEVEARATIAIKENEITKLHAEIKSRDEKVLELQKIVLELEGDNKRLKQRGEDQEVKIKGMESLAQAKSGPEHALKPNENFKGKGLSVDVGFKFKGKNIVFIIDVSGSMVREDRIGQVKAGLKMLITSMPLEYKLDVLYFPGKLSKPYQPLWNGLNPLDSFRKNEIYRFLLNLRARGFTPTRSALTYALNNYAEASDIVLLSDGAPTAGNSNKEADISRLLLDISKLNKKNVRINTIGVGSSFLKNKDSKAYVFLQELARDHGGFFFGF